MTKSKSRLAAYIEVVRRLRGLIAEVTGLLVALTALVGVVLTLLR
jgi:hypothetical protein